MLPDQNGNGFHLLCAAINGCTGNLDREAACCCRGDRHSCYFCLVIVHWHSNVKAVLSCKLEFNFPDSLLVRGSL